VRYRALSDDGDYVFGRGPGEFYVDSPEAVAQAIRTRLGLSAGEWFLDADEGTPWFGGVLGEHTQAIYDQVIKDRILGTQDVISIDRYASQLDEQRRLAVAAVVSTSFGRVGLEVVAPLNTPGQLDVNFILDVSTLG
jgi:hypothetical protein